IFPHGLDCISTIHKRRKGQKKKEKYEGRYVRLCMQHYNKKKKAEDNEKEEKRRCSTEEKRRCSTLHFAQHQKPNGNVGKRERHDDLSIHIYMKRERASTSRFRPSIPRLILLHVLCIIEIYMYCDEEMNRDIPENHEGIDYVIPTIFSLSHHPAHKKANSQEKEAALANMYAEKKRQNNSRTSSRPRSNTKTTPIVYPYIRIEIPYRMKQDLRYSLNTSPRIVHLAAAARKCATPGKYCCRCCRCCLLLLLPLVLLLRPYCSHMCHTYGSGSGWSDVGSCSSETASNSKSSSSSST
ncbi:unnamed protein product, partial [Rangifer tarandus platyrhynchus]